MNNTKIGDIERLHKLHVSGAISETEFKLLKKQIMGEFSSKIDNKVYKSVRIGKQEWMDKNLNVEHFRNGERIPEAKTNEEWTKAGKDSQPAWCYYTNNSSNGEKYGKLYNFYAVIDSRGLAPTGWHVPTDSEWTVLTKYLSANGHDRTEGKALKAATAWYSGRNGTDDYGWKALPGGVRGPTGNFNVIGHSGYWWSSSQNCTSDAWHRLLIKYEDEVFSSKYSKWEGYSVRCLKD